MLHLLGGTPVDNYDEGLDFDTAGTADGEDDLADLDSVNIIASGNGDEAIKLSADDEDDGGDTSVFVSLRGLLVDGDVEVEEFGDVEVEEFGDGDSTVRLSGSWIGDDFRLTEEGNGDLDIVVTGSTIEDDLKPEESGPGSGTIKVRGSSVGDPDYTGFTEI